MNQQGDSNVYIVPTGSVLLVYSPLRQMSALVNRRAVQELNLPRFVFPVIELGRRR